MRRKPKPDPWYAWTLVALAALVFTNAGWFYRWKVREAEHAEAIQAARSAIPREPRVIYEYRDHAGRQLPDAGQPHATDSKPSPPGTITTRTLGPDEQCFRGVVMRRAGNTIESTGERCRTH